MKLGLLVFRLSTLENPVFWRKMLNQTELTNGEWQAFHGLLLLNPQV